MSEPGLADVHMDWRHTGRFCIASLAMDLANGMFFVALPYLALAFGADSMQLGILTALRGAAYVLACVPVSMLSDRVSRKFLIGISMVAVCLTFVATSTASQYWHLCLLAVLWALAVSPFWPSLFSWVGDSHSAEQLGTATGAVNVSWSVGGMFGGLLAGWLFGIGRALPFLVAIIPVCIAGGSMLASECGHGRPRKTPPGAAVPGTKRMLSSVWLGNVSVCSMLGLMSGVFPKLGADLGVNASIFGLLMGGLALGRSCVFVIGLRWGRRLHGWLLAMAVQLMAAGMVGTVYRTSSRLWLAFVFLAVGIAVGVNYYRGLYKSLEGAGSRGLKSGLHEATLLSGILIGSLGGGAVARDFGLRMPYVVVGGLVVFLIVLQGICLASAHNARRRFEADVEEQDHGPRQ